MFLAFHLRNTNCWGNVLQKTPLENYLNQDIAWHQELFRRFFFRSQEITEEEKIPSTKYIQEDIQLKNRSEEHTSELQSR